MCTRVEREDMGGVNVNQHFSLKTKECVRKREGERCREEEREAEREMTCYRTAHCASKTC